MNDDKFWEQRLNHYKIRLNTIMIDYCDIYDILHDGSFNADTVKNELTEIIDNAIKSFLADNDK